MPHDRQYTAFISYSHQDERWARWLQRALELYRVPKRLRGTAGERGEIPGRLRPVFRDRDELPAGADLSERIQSALRHSRFLIVVCSPAAARSSWVAQEILEFKRLGGASRVLSLIVDGEPGAGGDQECFPEVLRFQLDERGVVSDAPAEPIAADLRPGKDGKSLARLKLIAGMLGVGLDDLRRREQLRKQRRLAYIAGASLAGMVVMGWLAWTAVLARDDAQRRQAQAEDLVDYMLNDLHAELEAVGRLDAMSATARKAMSYFAALDPRDLTDQALQGRAEALRQIGNIHHTQFEYDDAAAAFAEAHRMDSELLDRAPDDTQRKFNLGQSEFWLGYVSYEKGDYPTAIQHLTRYLDISQALYEVDPENADWVMELGYAHNNLAAVYRETGDLDEALDHMKEVVRLNRLAIDLQPDDPDLRVDLAVSLSWMGTVQRGNGQLAESARNRTASRELYQALLSSDPDNAHLKDELAYAWRGEGLALRLLGLDDESFAAYQQSLNGFDELIRIDSENVRWARDRMETTSEFMLAQMAADRPGMVGSDDLLTSLDSLDARTSRSGEVASPQRYGRQLLAEAVAGLAQLETDPDAGRQRIQAALDALRELQSGEAADPDINLWLVEVVLIHFDAGLTLPHEELRALVEAFAARVESIDDPLYLSATARAWFVLGEADRARPIVMRLFESGFNSKRFDRVCLQAGICPPE